LTNNKQTCKFAIETTIRFLPMARLYSAIFDVLDYIPEMICIVNVKLQNNKVQSSIIRCNKDATCFIGYNEPTILKQANRFFDSILHHNDREQYSETIKNIIANPTTEHAVLFRVKPRGANEYVVLTGWCHMLDSGELKNDYNLIFTLYKQVANEIKPLSLINSRNRRIVANVLTQREKEFAQHLVNGNTDKEIAKLLDISVCTAKNHRSNIKNKLDKRNATELVCFLVSAGVGEGDLL